MRLYLYPSNLSIVFYQTTAFVEKQVMPLSVGENANRWSRKRQSLLERTPIAGRENANLCWRERQSPVAMTPCAKT